MTLLTTCLVAIAFALAAPSAQAQPPAGVDACPSQPLSQVFLRDFRDPAFYALVPGGTFETPAGWSLSGAVRVRGNESFYINGGDDQWSLSVPPGSSATSPDICVGVEYPVIRFLLRNAGSKTSLLRVQVLYRDRAGNSQSASIGGLSGGPDWAATAPLPLVLNNLALSSGNQAFIRLRFTTTGSGGDWRIDGVHVDPYRKG